MASSQILTPLINRGKLKRFAFRRVVFYQHTIFSSRTFQINLVLMNVFEYLETLYRFKCNKIYLKKRMDRSCARPDR